MEKDFFNSAHSLGDFRACRDLTYCVLFSIHTLKQLQTYLEMCMDYVSSDMEKASEDSVLFRNYNTCGYLLASVRDILKDFDYDGK